MDAPGDLVKSVERVVFIISVMKAVLIEKSECIFGSFSGSIYDALPPHPERIVFFGPMALNRFVVITLIRFLSSSDRFDLISPFDNLFGEEKSGYKVLDTIGAHQRSHHMPPVHKECIGDLFDDLVEDLFRTIAINQDTGYLTIHQTRPPLKGNLGRITFPVALVPSPEYHFIQVPALVSLKVKGGIGIPLFLNLFTM